MAIMSDRVFIRRFSAVLAGLVGFAIIFVIIASVVSIGVEGHPNVRQELKARRLTPVAKVVTNPKALMASTQKQSAAKPAMSGQQVVAQVCSACHQAGMLGAPKIGDAADWGHRYKTQGGLKGLVNHAIHGIGQMPPRGGNPALTEQDIHNAVKYMLSKAGISG